MNAANLLFKTAEDFPKQTALVFRKHPMSYEELALKVKEKAVGFSKYGITDGSHVGLMAGNKPEYVIAYFALLSLGATVVPINPFFKEKEITYILNDAEATALIVGEIGLEEVKKCRDRLSTVNMIFSIPNEQLFIHWDQVSGDSSDFFPEAKNPDDHAQIIYTSGTTGKPKGAIITHGNLVWMTNTSAVVTDMTNGDRVLVVLPLFHAYAKLQGLLQCVLKGATVYLEERFIPDAILQSLAENHITVFLGVPTMYTMFVHSPKIKQLQFPHLRLAGCGGASLPIEIMEKVKAEMGVELGEGYGQTESTVMISCFPQNVPKKYGSVGLPLPGIELKIIDPAGRQVPVGEVGEIIFRGPNAMKGYYKKDEATRETIVDGWVYTGDLGKRDEQGYLYIVDRKKDMIIRGGYNVYPREIEEVLYSHPDIIECAVVGETDPIFGEEIAAYIVTRMPRTADDISNYCKQHLAHYKIPRRIYFLPELPKTATGKILKTPLKRR